MTKVIRDSEPNKCSTSLLIYDPDIFWHLQCHEPIVMEVKPGLKAVHICQIGKETVRSRMGWCECA